MNNSEKYLELISLLKKHTFLTSDSFDYPDRTYIYLDERYNNPIRFVDFGITLGFNLDIYKNTLLLPLLDVMVRF